MNRRFSLDIGSLELRSELGAFRNGISKFVAQRVEASKATPATTHGVYQQMAPAQRSFYQQFGQAAPNP